MPHTRCLRHVMLRFRDSGQLLPRSHNPSTISVRSGTRRRTSSFIVSAAPGKLRVYGFQDNCLEFFDRFSKLDLEYEELVINSPC